MLDLLLQPMLPANLLDWIPRVTHMPSGRILHMTPQLVDLLGQSEPTAYADIEQFTAARDHMANRLHFEQTLRSNRPSFWHTSLVRQDHSELEILLAAYPQPDGIIESLVVPANSHDNGHRTLVAALLLREDYEKRTLSRQLHDTTSQNLAALAINLSIIPTLPPGSPQIAGLVQECANLTDASLTEIRGIAYRLHPPLLDELGFLPAVRSYAQAYTRQTGIDVEVQAAEAGPRLAHHLESALFRMIQERLSYLDQNGDPTECRIEYAQTPTSIRLTISDNSDTESHVALDSRSAYELSLAVLQERAASVHAQLSVETASRSTRIHAIIAPVPNAAISDINRR